MSSKVIELRMSNVNVEPFDLVHQVSSLPGSVWASPNGQPKTVLEQSKNYRKYKHYFNNLLFLKDPALSNAYQELLERAQRDGKLVFECTCNTVCHLDAVRERLTEDLQKLGFTVTTNRVPYERHDSSEEED
jgi:hypothetical protein